jgi:hypothetical protein
VIGGDACTVAQQSYTAVHRQQLLNVTHWTNFVPKPARRNCETQREAPSSSHSSNVARLAIYDTRK